MAATTAYSVDDTDDQITYTGSWFQQTNDSEAYNRTLHWTSIPGSFASYSFDGTSVSVFGTITPSGSVLSTYLLDGKSVTTFSASNPNTTSNYHLFFQSTTLSDGFHSLEVVFNGSLPDLATTTPDLSGAGAALPTPTFWLDYLVVNESVSISPQVGNSFGGQKPLTLIYVLSFLGALIVLVVCSVLYRYCRRRIRTQRNVNAKDATVGRNRTGSGEHAEEAVASAGETTEISGAHALVSRRASGDVPTDDSVIVEVPRFDQ